LRGLAGSHGQIRFSRDGRRIAALSHNWEVGAWDSDTGQVLMCGHSPQGVYPNDHAALVFDTDALRIACQAGTQARLWDLKSGRLTRQYELPPGLGDALAFHRSGLLSIRFETAGKDRYPERPGAPAETHPRVIRIRELPAIGASRLLHELQDLPWHVYKIEAAPDGRFALADGRTGPGNDHVRLIVFDPLVGRLLWSIPLAPEAFTQFDIDPDGESIWHVPTGHNLVGTHVIRKHFEGRVIDPVPRVFQTRGRNGELVAHGDEPVPYGVVIRRAADGTPILHLARDAAYVERIVFDRTGKRFAWGQRDGAVMVADLDEVQRRLTGIGLGW
jgi:WD40 repeat protein